MPKHLFALLVVAVSLLTVTPTVQANEPIPFVPSPMIVVDRMLRLATIKSGDVFYDLGSGDGRVVIEAAKRFGVRGVGIDLNAELVAQARENAKREGVSHLVEFRAQDGLTVDISDATVVTLYMFSWFNNQMRPKLQKLKPGSRIVAHDFGIDDWEPTHVTTVATDEDPANELTEDRTLYLWVVGAQHRPD